jgi:hypothetical protein
MSMWCMVWSILRVYACFNSTSHLSLQCMPPFTAPASHLSLQCIPPFTAPASHRSLPRWGPASWCTKKVPASRELGTWASGSNGWIIGRVDPTDGLLVEWVQRMDFWSSGSNGWIVGRVDPTDGLLVGWIVQGQNVRVDFMLRAHLEPLDHLEPLAHLEPLTHRCSRE